MHEAAEYIGVSYKCFHRHYKDDWKIPHHVIGRRVLFRERALEVFIDQCTETPETDLGKWLAGQRREIA